MPAVSVSSVTTVVVFGRSGVGALWNSNSLMRQRHQTGKNNAVGSALGIYDMQVRMQNGEKRMNAKTPRRKEKDDFDALLFIRARQRYRLFHLLFFAS